MRAVGESRGNVVVPMWAPSQDEGVRRARDKQILLMGKEAFEGRAILLPAAMGKLEVGKRKALVTRVNLRLGETSFH